jgi:hypothetical protein
VNWSWHGGDWRVRRALSRELGGIYRGDSPAMNGWVTVTHCDAVKGSGRVVITAGGVCLDDGRCATSPAQVGTA